VGPGDGPGGGPGAGPDDGPGVGPGDGPGEKPKFKPDKGSKMKQLSDYKDDYGLICTKPNGQFDGGDTLANEFTVLYVQALQGNADARLQIILLRESGRWRRHCDVTKWYAGTNRTSRDQLTPLMAFLVAHKPSKDLYWELVRSLACRGFLFAFNTRKNFQYPTLLEHQQKSTPDVDWNYKWKVPDVLGPDIWALLARGAIEQAPNRVIQILFSALLRPILWLGDLQLIGAALVSQYKFKFKAHKGTGRAGIDHDDRNQALKTDVAQRFSPTLLSKVAGLIYGTARPLACFASFWASEEEPPIDKFISLLYSELKPGCGEDKA